MIVFETVGSVDEFIGAVKRIPGMSWLADWEDEIPQDDDFYIEGEDEELMSGRLYLIMSNQHAIDQLISLFRRFRRNPDEKFEHGLNKWKEVFRRLRDVRRWSHEDRLRETGVLEAFREDLENGQERLRFEAELWCRETTELQNATYDAFRETVENERGRCVSQCLIPEIAYHAVLVEAPRATIEPIVQMQETRMVLAEQVMFFRPTGQSIVPSPEEMVRETIATDLPAEPAAQASPTVALLDGLPIENHEALVGRLVVDDPDGWAGDCPTTSRVHGTAMASLIVRGELDTDESPLNRPVYVRPVMKPDPRNWHNPGESVPPDVLFVDLLYRAVRRILEGEGASPAAAPEVRVINLSIGDPSQPFNRYLSATARLLDWLAHKYNLLFVVSAGNYPQDIELTVDRQALRGLSAVDLQGEVLRAVQLSERNRKLLSPAEAINALTVGAAHADGCPFVNSPGALINPGIDGSMPTPYSRFGPGFRRAIKPEILTSGGRALYRERLDVNTTARRQFVNSTRQPGHRVACPGTRPGDTAAVCYSRGTSDAAALTARAAGLGLETLLGLRQPNGDELDENSLSVILKSLMVHTATWGDAFDQLRAALRLQIDRRSAREYLSRYLAYGVPQFRQALLCHDQQATMLGTGTLSDGDAHVFQIPLPPSLRAQAVWRRLTITLAWNSPINPRSQKYRIAQLWFGTNTDLLRVEGQDAWWQSVRRGTLQHEIWEGAAAPAYPDNSTIEVQVNCKAEAGKIIDPVRYGLAVTLQVREGLDIPLYDEIRTRVYAPITITP
ncbi:MAG: S8 family peptidase [Acidobacteria bacterium]|nr:S8 family peptidase [Acidobacteriota bacterium]